MTHPLVQAPRAPDAPAALQPPYGTPANIVRISTAVRHHDFVGPLESVRGLAALTVLIFHSTDFFLRGQDNAFEKTLWQLESIDQLLRRSVAFFFNGHIAVSLFFVLSGFVLALSLRRDDRIFSRQAAGFVGRRFFRIYPALAANLLVTAAVMAILAAAYPTIAYAPFTWGQLAENLVLHDFGVNGATWTLLVELLAIPLLLVGYLSAFRFGIAGILTLAAATIYIHFSPGFILRHLPELHFMSYVRVYIVDYQFMFILGMLVAELPLRDRFRDQLRGVKYAMVAAVVAMLSARFLLGYLSRGALFIEGASAAVLVGLLAYGPSLPVHNLLNWRPVRFLGRISYSFYLYHLSVLLVLIPTARYIAGPGLQAHPLFASLIIPTIAAAVTIPLAWLSYSLVELPMIRLGRRL